MASPPIPGQTSPRDLRGLRVPLVGLLVAVYLCFAPGRLLFPDDEIVFQTTASLVERGTFAIAGIPKRTGEPKGRPDGTFGWAPGRDGRRYGFFGHGLSLVAIPAYLAGKLAARAAPEPWRHALRSDHYVYHRRGQSADWTRLAVSLTNSAVTAATAAVLATWLCALGFGAAAATGTALAYGLGTFAFPYAGTFLSEPLSALVLLGCALLLTRGHRAPSPARARGAYLAAAALAGLSAHVHLLNLVELPALVAYFLWGGPHRPARATVLAAFAVGAAALALLGLDHALRYGSPFESGRYGHYGRWAWPWTALLAFAVAPGRALLLYTPAASTGLWGLRRAWRRVPAALALAGALVALRVLFAAARSDWWGGWGLGPRYLVPVVPFLMIPLAAVLDDWPRLSRRARVATGVALALSVAAMAYLSAYSVFEHMYTLMRADPEGPPSYLWRSHWELSWSPYLAFARLPQLDVLPLGAWRLARVGHPGPLACFVAVAAAGLACAGVLMRRLARLAPAPGREHPARHVPAAPRPDHPPS